MNNPTPHQAALLQQQTQAAADFLKTVGNANRLQVLCLLAQCGELSVGQLQEGLTPFLAQSALSQHLAKMRSEGIVASRQAGQKIYYRISDGKTLHLITLLKTLFCPEPNEGADNEPGRNHPATSDGTEPQRRGAD